MGAKTALQGRKALFDNVYEFQAQRARPGARKLRDMEVSFACPEGMQEAAAALGFLPGDEAGLKFVAELARVLQ